ncbi:MULTISPECIES: efflux RND transporter periplasmic adaptor subunit [Providencia]|uniref:Membrane fusion protein of RND family multidrug efflux pump n=1 Tax=Providencia heimbachae ATCC 35613 TaxID=1354272 RepID=A0A1B7JMS2_9GAMM|nr:MULTISPECIES: efflux RND transporter periplasmic adaptor subunit [Providencia]MBP6123300.1 efflux RND transporter periplasmic adaptor subunit [Providencia sp.]MDD9340455.1 efflux RND transporter periplasmic adaptor subunit [Providencia heimbachae]NIH21754.1 efflux RND transporter periplasmic adaptor subunit [Providencia heimbachae]OAT49170.1 membrane fusion protein of RND family multidrug efflux pump [Providencia heimbachae ATCC 35613]QCJ69295.1 efflux RND transporter periplasmic adaptor su
MRKNRGVLPLALLVLSGGLVLSGCNDDQKGGGERPAPEVGIVTLKAEPLTIKTELPGRTSAFRVAEVRPQVSGIVLKRNYKEGSDVEAGTSLYQIDPAPFQATFDSAKAELAKAQANANLAGLTVKRYKPLLGTNYISQQEYDQATSTYAQALAAVKAAEAAVESARINLNYTKVTAPISGRTGKSNITEGALVSTGQATELMRVQQLDPIYVDVTQSSEDFLRLKNEIAKGAVQKEAGKAPVSLISNNGQEFTQKGTLEFSDVTVDETTGSITMRAVFPNPDKELLPGMFVRAILEDGVIEQAILVPQQGLSRTAQGTSQVMVVGAENKIEVRQVKAAQAIGNKWLVTDGLQAGDRVVVIGLQKIKPGVVVVPKEANLETQSIDNQAKPEEKSK